MSQDSEERTISVTDDVTIFFGIDVESDGEFKPCQFLLKGEMYEGYLSVDEDMEMFLHFGAEEEDYFPLQSHWIINPLQQWEKDIIDGMSRLH